MREAGKVRVLYEPTGIVLDEVGQGAFAETERNPLSLDVLLSDTSDNLGDVDVGTLGSGHHLQGFINN